MVSSRIYSRSSNSSNNWIRLSLCLIIEEMEEMLVESKKKIPAKRVNVVSLKVVKESSVLYETRNITNPYDAFRLVKSFLENSDREKFVVACLDTK